jgi:xylan 1,4-beta-xylosidase
MERVCLLNNPNKHENNGIRDASEILETNYLRMNKNNWLFILISILGVYLITGCKSNCNDLVTSEIFYADPTIFAENNKYYLTGTRNIEPYGFAILVSENLIDWRSPSEDSLHMILMKGDGAFGTEGFWAPQILKVDDTYYLTYTANEQVVISKSNSLLGPYRQDITEPVDESEKNIDSFIFQDIDGTWYLYHVRFDRGNYLWVAELDFETGKIRPETLTKCFDQTEAWEATPNYISDPILEGPTVLHIKGKYYMFYSANHFLNIDYAVGYATADSPFGPWVKHPDNPIIHRSIVGENGSGHGDIFEGLDDVIYYVYHVHNSDSTVVPRRTRIVPLLFEWDESEGIYNVTADSNNIIVPVIAD